jgi:hypothetical protein
MSVHELPAHVHAFLSQFASSLDELAILLALIESRTEWWDAGSMGSRVGLPALSTRRVLDAFASRNLLDIRISDNVRYRLRPGTADLARDVDAVVGACRHSPGAVQRWASAQAARLRSGAGR